MRILHLISDTDRRGAQSFAVALAGELESRGHQVALRALTPGTGADRLDVDVLGSTRARGTWRLRHSRGEYDITVAHGSTTLLAAALVRTAGGAPFVYRQISDPRIWAGSAPRRLRVSTSLRRAAAVATLSPGLRDVLHTHLGVPRSKLRVIPNGADSSAFVPATDDERQAARARLGLDPDRPTLLCIGALVPEKGVDTAITVARNLPDVQLLVVGDGPDERRLRSLAGDGHEVVFGGALADIRPAYQASDVLVLPSHTEGLPAVIIEAGMCGLPAVASDVGFVHDVITEGVTGHLVALGETDRFEDAVRAALGPAGAAMGTRAREEYADEFDLRAVAEAWEELLLDAAAGPLDGPDAVS